MDRAERVERAMVGALIVFDNKRIGSSIDAVLGEATESDRAEIRAMTEAVIELWDALSVQEEEWHPLKRDLDDYSARLDALIAGIPENLRVGSPTTWVQRLLSLADDMRPTIPPEPEDGEV